MSQLRVERRNWFEDVRTRRGMRRAAAIVLAGALLGITPRARAACLSPVGDVTGNGVADVVDVVCGVLTTLWQLNGQGGPAPACLPSGSWRAADTDCNGNVDVVDVQMLAFQALGLPLSVAVDANGDGCADACADATPPVVTITAPKDGDVYASTAPIAVTGTVQDDSPVTVSVQGLPATVASDGTFSATGVPLQEGRNVLVATAVDAAGNTATASIVVRVDTTPPRIVIETPPDDVLLDTEEVDVTGMVNDLVQGTTIQLNDVTVMVNGVAAQLWNRAWMVAGLRLQPGDNTIEAVATDAAGNVGKMSVVVHVDPLAGQRIVAVSGSEQLVAQGEQVPDPLVVQLLDRHNDPVPGHLVRFRVVRGDGVLINPPDEEGRELTVTSDDDGLARIRFRVGQRTGQGNQRVVALADGFAGYVLFSETATLKAAARLLIEVGNEQRGAPGAVLPMPLKVLVVDANGNPVPDEPVVFEVVKGTGNLEGQASVVLQTNSDGEAATDFTLGPEVGQGAHHVHVYLANQPSIEVEFVETALQPGPDAATRLTGIVLDNEDRPLEGVTVRIDGTSLTTTTDVNGRFELLGVPVGRIRLVADGSTSPAGNFPALEYEITTVPGAENTVGGPIYLPRLNDTGMAAAVVGGDYAVTLRLPESQQTTLTVYPHSVTCADGSSECLVSLSQVRLDRVPMPPPQGSSFPLALTIQPYGTTFDPPAKLCVPVGDPTLKPGTQLAMYSFDHDLEDWVAIGPGTVTSDGRICTDPGFGVVKAGWHGPPRTPPPQKCVGECKPSDPQCQTAECKNGKCVVTNHGGSCTLGGNTNPCVQGQCVNGACTPVPNDGAACPLSSSDPCKVGQCQAGVCTPKPKPDGTPCQSDALNLQDACKKRTCQGGVCKATSNPMAQGADCSGNLPAADYNECNQYTCQPGAGGQLTCTPTPKPASAPCGVGKKTCINQHCDGNGNCVSDYAPNHTDCTKERPAQDPQCQGAECDGQGNCLYTTNGNPCSDGKFCTCCDDAQCSTCSDPEAGLPMNDHCMGGQCIGAPFQDKQYFGGASASSNLCTIFSNTVSAADKPLKILGSVLGLTCSFKINCKTSGKLGFKDKCCETPVARMFWKHPFGKRGAGVKGQAVCKICKSLLTLIPGAGVIGALIPKKYQQVLGAACFRFGGELFGAGSAEHSFNKCETQVCADFDAGGNVFLGLELLAGGFGAGKPAKFSVAADLIGGGIVYHSKCCIGGGAPSYGDAYWEWGAMSLRVSLTLPKKIPLFFNGSKAWTWKLADGMKSPASPIGCSQ